MGKMAASLLLKMFIYGNERCYTTDTPFSNVNNIQNNDPRGSEKDETSYFTLSLLARFSKCCATCRGIKLSLPRPCLQPASGSAAPHAGV